MMRPIPFRTISFLLLGLLLMLNLASARHFHLCQVRMEIGKEAVVTCCSTTSQRAPDDATSGADCCSSEMNSPGGCDCALDSQPPIDERQTAMLFFLSSRDSQPALLPLFQYDSGSLTLADCSAAAHRLPTRAIPALSNLSAVILLI
jgi:hypothetical protein